MDDVLGYFITWSCYGSHVPGDERGWTQWGAVDRPPQPYLQGWCRIRMLETE